jgi:hypothetical protein
VYPFTVSPSLHFTYSACQKSAYAFEPGINEQYFPVLFLLSLASVNHSGLKSSPCSSSIGLYPVNS